MGLLKSVLNLILVLSFFNLPLADQMIGSFRSGG